MTVDIENRKVFVIGMALLMLPLAIAAGGILAKVQQAASPSSNNAPNSFSSLLEPQKPEKHQSSNVEVAPSAPEQQEPAPATPTQPEPSPNSPQIQGLYRLVIKTCAGTPSGANFRRSPNGAIVGFVPAGEAVYLLGETAQGTWSKVINEAPLGVVPEVPDAFRDRQVGWISSCFVE